MHEKVLKIVQNIDFTYPQPSLPKNYPEDLTLAGEAFIPEKHLQIEPPSRIKDLDFKDVPFPFDDDQKSVKGHLAYTTPFRVLSDEGIKAARRELARNEHLSRSNPRASCYVRGLGYTSRFHQELAYDPTLTEMLNQLSRDQVAIHTMTMNISHTNVGKVATGRPVDKWHTDSTPYVLVLILSDLTEMEGGTLRVLQMPDATGNVFNVLTINGVPEDLVEIVRYTAAGYAIFMQGSKILHTVDAVLKAREPRISLVNSYMRLNPFVPDQTRYSTFTEDGFNDPEHILPVEFARHKAWRAAGKMQYLLEHVPFEPPASSAAAGGGGRTTAVTSVSRSNPKNWRESISRLIATENGPDVKAGRTVTASAVFTAAVFEEAAEELRLAASLLRRTVDDNAKWVDVNAVSTDTNTPNSDTATEEATTTTAAATSAAIATTEGTNSAAATTTTNTVGVASANETTAYTTDHAKRKFASAFGELLPEYKQPSSG